MKRTLCLSLALMLLMALFCATASAEPGGACGENIAWSVDLELDMDLSIYGVEGATGPMRDYSLTEPSPFNDSLGVTWATIWPSVTHIGSYAFAGYSTLDHVIIINDDVTFGENPFLGCSSELELWARPRSTAQAYARANSIRFHPLGITGACGENVTWSLNNYTLIIDGTGSMEDYASAADTPFQNDLPIERVLIRGGVTHIGAHAFDGLDILDSITIHNPEISFGADALHGCDLGMTLYGSDGSTTEAYAESEGFPFANPSCGDYLTYSFDSTGKMTVSGTGATWAYPDADSPFWQDKSITAVEFSEGVTDIGSHFIGFCENLSTATLPDTLESIGDSVFFICGRLASARLPANLQTVGRDAFWGCDMLSHVNIPANTLNLGSNAFGRCSGLVSIGISNPTLSIGEGCFSYCTALRGMVGWPDSTAQALAAELNVDYTAWKTSGTCGDNTSWSINLDTRTGYITGTGATWDYDNILSDRPFAPFFDEDLIRTAVVGEGVTALGRGLFTHAVNLQNVTLPTTLESIGELCFAYCDSLRTVPLPTGLQTIGSSAFRGSEKLFNLILPYSLRSIGDNAFQNCVGLGGLIFNGNDVSFGSGVFDGCRYGFVFYCYSDSTARSYARAHGFPVDLPQCGPNTKLDRDRAGKVTVLGSGEMYSGFGSPFVDDPSVLSAELQEGVTSVSSSLFYGCTNLANVSLPSTLTRLGGNAFRECTSLTELTIPAKVTEIGDDAFNGCTALQSVKIYNRSANIWADAFADCPKLTISGWAGSTAKSYAEAHSIPFAELNELSPCGDNVGWRFDPASGTVTISGSGPMWDYPHGGEDSPFRNDRSVRRVVVESGVTSIGAYFFDGCRMLDSISLPAGLTGIRRSAFNYAIITELSLPEGLEEIGAYAFANCGGLAAVSFPESLRTIDENAFMYCVSLQSVTLPQSLTDLGCYAFWRCAKLGSVTILSRSAAIDASAFDDCADGPVIYGRTDSTAQIFASENSLTFLALDPEPDFCLPSALSVLEEDAFRGVDAEAVVFPEGIRTIIGNPFADSGLRCVYGYPGSAAEVFASAYGYFFVPLGDGQ